MTVFSIHERCIFNLKGFPSGVRFLNILRILTFQCWSSFIFNRVKKQTSRGKTISEKLSGESETERRLLHNYEKQMRNEQSESFSHEFMLHKQPVGRLVRNGTKKKSGTKRMQILFLYRMRSAVVTTIPFEWQHLNFFLPISETELKRWGFP